MKIKVITEVEAPEGATHYFGDLLADPIWVKFVEGDPNSYATRQRDQWYEWKNGQWFFLSEHRPHWIKEIPPQ